MADQEEKKDNSFVVEGLGTVEIISEARPKQIVDGKEKPAKPGILRLSQPDLFAFYEKHGVDHPKTVFDAINKARADFVEAVVPVLKDKVIETGLNWELHAGQQDHRVDVGLDAMRTNRNIQTGETQTKYGVVSVNAHAPNPFEGKSDKYAELSADIENSMKKRLGLK